MSNLVNIDTTIAEYNFSTDVGELGLDVDTGVATLEYDDGLEIELIVVVYSELVSTLEAYAKTVEGGFIFTGNMFNTLNEALDYFDTMTYELVVK